MIIEKLRSEHQEMINQMKNEHEKKRILTTTIDIQTEEQLKYDKQTNSTHMIENLSIFDFELDIQDMMILACLDHPITKLANDPRLIL
jgi:diketogulonate reductase-like aldo/keto reductase